MGPGIKGEKGIKPQQKAAIQRVAMVRICTRRGDAFADHAGDGLL